MDHPLIKVEPAKDFPESWQRSETGVPSAESVVEMYTDREKRLIEDPHPPGHRLDNISPVEKSNPGSRVLPFDRKMSFKIQDIERNVSKSVRDKAKNYTPKLFRVDPRNRVWLFNVGKWRVRVKADLSGRATKLTSADLKVSCSCPFWRWQGPEHWGKTEDYQYGKFQGTATFPKIRDPGHEKAVCKHVYAVLQELKGFRIPPRPKRKPPKKKRPRKKRGMAGMMMAEAIVERYLAERGAHACLSMNTSVMSARGRSNVSLRLQTEKSPRNVIVALTM